MTNLEKINHLDTQIKELEDKLEQYASLPDELEILLALQKLYEDKNEITSNPSSGLQFQECIQS